MKKTGVRWWLKRGDNHALNAFIEHIRQEWAAGKDPTVQFLESDRTDNQNAMFYGLYRDIALAMKDKSQIEVKRECKLRYGIGILKGADPEFTEWYDRVMKPLDYETKLMLMDEIPVTSQFTKAQASEYIDTILSEYAKHGIRIPDPRYA